MWYRNLFIKITYMYSSLLKRRLQRAVLRVTAAPAALTQARPRRRGRGAGGLSGRKSSHLPPPGRATARWARTGASPAAPSPGTRTLPVQQRAALPAPGEGGCWKRSCPPPTPHRALPPSSEPVGCTERSPHPRGPLPPSRRRFWALPSAPPELPARIPPTPGRKAAAVAGPALPPLRLQSGDFQC